MLFWLIIRIRKPVTPEIVEVGRRKEDIGFIKMLHIKLDSMLRKSLFYSSFIRITIQGFFQLSVMTTLVYAEYFFWDSTLTTVNSAVYIWLGLCLLVLTIFTGYFLHKQNHNFEDPEFKTKYGTLFDN